MRAPAIVLATGKFMGGGMVADPVCRETALGCPVGLRRFGRSFHDATDSLLLTSELRTDTQPMLGVGICTNAESNPVYDSGDVIYDNVFVAGSIRAGVETASLGLGDAAADGWNAGLHAAAHARVMA
jgi:anaerobic glycerol-3-phosphate dehydrogenase